MCHADSSGALAIAFTNTQWRRRRLWFAPPPHVLLQRALVAAHGTVQLAAQLSRSHLAYLWDHQVQVAEIPTVRGSVGNCALHRSTQPAAASLPLASCACDPIPTCCPIVLYAGEHLSMLSYSSPSCPAPCSRPNLLFGAELLNALWVLQGIHEVACTLQLLRQMPLQPHAMCHRCKHSVQVLN
jgi:hypothetical protein